MRRTATVEANSCLNFSADYVRVSRDLLKTRLRPFLSTQFLGFWKLQGRVPVLIPSVANYLH